MTTTRQKILSYLMKSRPASAREIARSLNSGPANIRHHLARLASDGRVSVTGERREGRGRPEKLYSLSRALRGDNLPTLLEALIEERLEGLTDEQKEAALASLGRRMAGPEAARSGLTPARRLGELVERLNRGHYEARWEAGAGGPHVIFGQCPYAAVIEALPGLCLMDAAMLEAALGLPARQKTKLHPACLFILG